ncbi:hypothetical protein M3Y95_01207500 [Aphelenchoides besseyi]|nr:hypothetical protein M3Y95_01207500 [Aphelenchoides besseyi]
MEPLTPKVANREEASALVYGRGYNETFCENFGIVGRGAHLCDRTTLKKSTLVRLPCKCSGDLCKCGALNFLQLIDKKVGEVLLNERTDSPKWLNSAVLPRMSFLNQLHRKVHENEEEKLSEANRDAIDDLLRAFRSLSRKRRWLLAQSIVANSATLDPTTRTYVLQSEFKIERLYQFPSSSIADPPTKPCHQTQYIYNDTWQWYTYHPYKSGDVTQVEQRGQYHPDEYYKRHVLRGFQFREYEKPPTKTEIEKKLKMAEEKERQVRQTIPIVQFVQKERKKKKRPQSFPHHVKDRIDNPWKLPSHLVTYDEPLDFGDYADEYSEASNSSALTIGDCLVLKQRRVSSDSDWSIITY